MLLRLRQYLLGTASWLFGGAGLTGADALLEDEADGFAIDATVPGGSVSVQESVVAFASSNLTNSSVDGKYVRLEDGTLSLTSAGDIPQSYDPVGLKYGILIEPAATNLLLRSQEFDNAYWTSTAGVWTDGTTAPDGTATADTLSYDGAGGTIDSAVTVTGSAVYTTSLYVKPGAGVQWLRFEYTHTGFSDRVRVWFDLLNGVVGSSAVVGSGVYTNHDIEALANGWYRIWVTGSITQTSGALQFLLASADNTNSQPATVGLALSVWGAQMELGSIPTSYIPTTSATVTRAADDVNALVSTLPFSATAGTVYADYLPSVATGTQVVWHIDDTTGNERIYMYRSTNDPLVSVIDGGVNQLAPLDLGTITGGARSQTTFAWAANDFAGSHGGGAVGTDVGGTLPTMTTFRLGNDQGTSQLNGLIYRLVYVPRQVETDDGDLENWRYNSTAEGAELLSGEDSGFAIDATVVGGSVLVKTVPDLSNVTFANSNLVNNSTSMKTVLWDDETLRYTPHNILLRSQELDVNGSGTPWNIIGGNVTVLADQIAAPDGTTTGDEFTSDPGTGEHYHVYQRVTTIAANIYTTSVYIKESNWDYHYVKFGDTDHWIAAVFDLSTGTVTQTDTGATSGTIVGTDITDEGDGWYRCSISGYVTATNPYTSIGIAGAATGQVFNTNGDPDFDHAGGAVWYLWGGQIEKNSQVSEYVPTTTAAAVGGIPQSWDGTRFGILIEPAATNLQVQSETFDNAAWGKSRCTVTASGVTAPDGSPTAETLTEDSTATNTHQTWDQLTLGGGTVATASIYAKAGTRSIFAFTYGGISGHWVTQIFDLTGAGGFGEVSVGGTSGTLVDKTITALANGWYRLTLTASITNANPWLGLGPAPLLTGNTFAATGNVTYSGNGTGSVNMWGVQAETGTVATSYIPTVGSTVTRVIDDITVDLTTIPFQQNPGTVYADYSARTVSGTKTVVTFTDGTDDDDEVSLRYSNADPIMFIDAGAVNQVNTDLGTAVVNTRHQMTVAWDTNAVDGSFDGAAPTNDASATMPTGMDELGLGDRPALNTPLNGHLYRLVYVPRHVENDDGDLENWRYNS
jgi:virulence-associated protein VapD